MLLNCRHGFHGWMRQSAASSHGPAYFPISRVKGSLRRAAPALDPPSRIPHYPLVFQMRLNFYGACYSSTILGQGANLVGTDILIYFDPQDLRFVQAFLPNGAELGPLQANAPWHRTAHSLRLRREILRLKRANDLTYGDADDPVAAYLESKRKKSVKTQRRSGHRIAEAARSLQTSSAHSVSPSQPTSPTPPAKPRRLAIGNQAQSK